MKLYWGWSVETEETGLEVDEEVLGGGIELTMVKF